MLFHNSLFLIIIFLLLKYFEITFANREIPKEVMQFIADNGFFGMIIPKEYGGLAFSAYAHSEVIIKVSSASTTVATVVSVPNSLGPAELLLNYGTKQQQDYYLLRKKSLKILKK